MVSPSEIRASDAERDAVLDRLRQAMVEGRLDQDEFSARTSTVLEARTVGELVGVTADLPPGPSRPLVGVAAGASPVPVGAAGRVRSWRTPALGLWGTVFAIACAVWLVGVISSGHVHGFWPVWLLIWGLFQFRHGYGHRGHRDQHRDRDRHDRR